MGLFDFFKKEEKKEKNFFPITIKTENVNNTLLKVSKEFDIPLSSLDFEILEIKTFIKTENEKEFIELDKESKILLKNEKFLRDEKNEIKQIYEIEIKKNEITDFELIGDIKINKKFTKAVFIISPQSLITESNIKEKFLNELNKKKLKNNLLIDLFDEKMKYSVEKVIAKYQILGEIKGEIILCEGLNEIPTREGKVIYHYKNKEKSIKKMLLYPVKKGDILIEIIKPKEGKPGRNCKGEIIRIEKIKNFKFPQIEHDETIKREENEEKILFIALKNGYLYKDEKFTIKDEIEVKQINIKTGDVRDARENDIKIKVKESNALKEAIGDNTTVETTFLTVKGTVGSLAVIKTKEVKIYGQTHQKSKIYTKKGEINIHKGYVEAAEIKINRLENGIVKADKAEISQVIGGKIFAKEVIINILGSHLTCYGLKKIEIKKIKGSENRLIISPSYFLEENKIEKLKKMLQNYKKELEINIKEYKKRAKIIKNNQNSINELKKIYLENRVKQIQTSPIILKKIKEFNFLKKETLKIKEKISTLKNEIEILEEEIETLQNIAFRAKIISYSPWSAYNRIEFDLITPPLKLTYDTKGDEGVCGFKLKDFGDIYKIVKFRLKENNDSST